MEHFFERGAEFEADMWIAEGFGRFAGDAGLELLGPRWRSPTQEVRENRSRHASALSRAALCNHHVASALA